MIVDIEQYAGMIGIVSGAVRKRMTLARRNGKKYSEVLPAVVETRKMGNSWVFTLDPKKVSRKGKINLDN